MEYFLICTNPRCRYLVNLRTGTRVLERSKLIVDECPECGHPWSANCPFCGLPLDSDTRGTPPLCTHCERSLLPEES
jgi:predicted amidophosphoribosyltransferase